jgi:hypothetical protein
MKPFHFTKTYFNLLLFEDAKAGVRVVINETPSINMAEEEYSLRVSTRFISGMIHKDYAIEHHLPPLKHNFPHLQFKFHTEEIGQFRIRIDVNNEEEYRQAILGFIYKIKKQIEKLENLSEGITNKILVVELVNELENEENVLNNKILEGIKKYNVEFDMMENNKIEKLKQNALLIEFFGKECVDLIKSKKT